MELAERCIKTLENEGFPHIYEWSDAPDTIYEKHAHVDKIVLFVTDGSIDMNVAGKEFTLHTGDRFDVPPGTEHSARVGSNGVQFVVGEMVAGDS